MGKRDDKKAEQEFEQMMKAAREGQKPGKRLDVNDGRNVVHTNKGVVISADVIEGGVNFQA